MMNNDVNDMPVSQIFGRTLASLPVSQSRVRTACRCKRKAIFQRAKLVPRHWVSTPTLRIGTMMHWYQQGHFTGAPVEKAEKRIVAARAGLETRLSERPSDFKVGPGQKTSAQVRAGWDEEADKARVMFDAAQEFLPWRSDLYEVVAAEVPVRGCVLPGIDLTVETGGIDLIVRKKADGEIWLVDHKGVDAKYPLQQYADGMVWDVQFWLYRQMAIHALKIDPALLKGCCLNLLHRPNIKLCSKDRDEADRTGVSPQQAYLTRVKDWYHLNSNGDPFLRAWIRYPKRPDLTGEQFEVLSEQKILWGQSNLVPDPPLRFYPRDPSRMACRDFMRSCEYMSLCNTPPIGWQQVIDDEYVVSEDAPSDQMDNDDLVN